MAETYDIEEYTARAGAALDKLGAEQKPGAKVGRASKAAILRTVRDRLQTLSGKGYTTGQMADALHPVFPKLTARAVRAALREAAMEGAKPRKRRAARRPRVGAAGSGDGRPTGSVTEPAPADRRPAAAHSDVPIAGAPPAHPGPASVPDGGTNAAPPTSASLPQSPLTPEQRAQHQIPDWASGADLRPGETLEQYARRKRVAGPPRDRSKFIGES